MSEHTARREFDSILDGLSRHHEADKRTALLNLAAGMRAESAKAGTKIPLSAIRTLLGNADVQFPTDDALKKALARAK